MPNNRMKWRAYMAWIGRAEEGALLVFAKGGKQAKLLAYPYLRGWYDGVQWSDIKVQWQRELPDHLWALHQGDKQVVESPPVCEGCDMWGQPMFSDVLCEDCYNERAEE